MFDFDTVIDRRATGSSKWSRYASDVLPMWVADMDFAVAPCILDALGRRLEHPVFGYAVPDDALRETIVDHLRALYNWVVGPEEIVFLPGVEPGFNMALKAFLQPGDAVAVQTPVYTPLLNAPGHWGLERVDIPLTLDGAEAPLFDPDAFRHGMDRAKALILCNPHNPTGKVFDAEALRVIAQACLDNDALIISDEIHAGIMFDGRRHIPIASLDEAVAQRTVTLMAASKAYNIAGLKTAFAIVRDPAMRQAFNAARLGMVDSVNALGLVATRAAYALGEPWKRALVDYLQANRDYLAEQVQCRLAGIRLIKPQGGFLAWLDCSKANLGVEPNVFFQDSAKVGLNAGLDFGQAGRGFARLNFGCPRSVLETGIGRMQAALAARSA
jgi:cystathionine beta-lyase